MLAILIIGISIAIAPVYFNDQSAAANRDGLTNDLINMSVRAHQYYVRQKTWGRGRKIFCGAYHAIHYRPSSKCTRLVLHSIC